MLRDLKALRNLKLMSVIPPLQRYELFSRLPNNFYILTFVKCKKNGTDFLVSTTKGLMLGSQIRTTPIIKIIMHLHHHPMPFICICVLFDNRTYRIDKIYNPIRNTTYTYVLFYRIWDTRPYTRQDYPCSLEQ